MEDEKGKCAMCGRKTDIEGTMFVDVYCIGCHKANIEFSREAIKTIQKRKKDRKEKNSQWKIS